MPTKLPSTPVILGVSLKMYFSNQETLDWCKRVLAIAENHPAVSNNLATLFILPSTPTLGAVGSMLASTKVKLGAQDLFYQDKGAFTGEVGGPMLRELGCAYVAIGHAERRNLFGETDQVVAEKLAAAIRNDLIPVLCVGEKTQSSAEEAAEICIKQIEAAGAITESKELNLVVAYEPVWAIGAEAPAPEAHILKVGSRITQFLATSERFRNSRVIYGGSAGPGLLTRLHGDLSGLFLGRFAHDTDNLVKVLNEVVENFSTESLAKV
jgi:triosephosphate isomerase